MGKDPATVLDRAFADQPEIRRGIVEAITRDKTQWPLFSSISHYVIALKDLSTATTRSDDDSPPSKKRRLADEVSSAPGASRNGQLTPRMNGDGGAEANVLLTVADVSFSVPQRKKMTLELTDRGLRARLPATGDIALDVAWTDFDHAACLPVPEKTQRQYSFCLFPTASSGSDALVWTVPDAAPDSASGKLKGEAPIKTETGTGEDATAIGTQQTYRTLLIDVLNQLLPNRVTVQEPRADEFASALVEAHRKSEKAYHVKAFRGSKDGYLFLLPTGILWAFKKPLLFLSFASIASVSYTSVLQRTFNLSIATQSTSSSSTSSSTSATATASNPADDSTAATATATATDAPPPAPEYEFSMIDQADFAGIDAYVKRHNLNDASMAEQRRAKRFDVERTNRTGGGGAKTAGDTDTNENGGSGSEPREIDKAVEELRRAEAGDQVDEEDEEDEEEEDYDPGSEGESEGEGVSSDDDDDGDPDGGATGEVGLHGQDYDDYDVKEEEL
ncbi:MAG: hypothetical protein M1825_006303 [Sarcosagium campestre]|nr:MAG: hypothetical protein M1825_006303 [Sarcosagium campestre]